MKPIISFVGPTAVGKTAASLVLAEAYLADGCSGVQIISADSRQVYQGLEVLTGADIPTGFEPATTPDFAYPFYQKDLVALHGISVIAPTEEWSVVHFQELALPIISLSQERDQAVIIVGGTGLYHDHLFSADPQLRVPPNPEIRNRAATLSIVELQDWLATVNPTWLAGLNNSDKNNPRRLIRALEISLQQPSQPETPEVPTAAHQYIGLSAPLETIQARIDQRVEDRFVEAVAEVAALQEQYDQLAQPVRTTMGFKELAAYASTEVDRAEVVTQWARREYQYAKRQFTWWNKRPEVSWIDTSDPGWQATVAVMTKSARLNQ